MSVMPPHIRIDYRSNSNAKFPHSTARSKCVIMSSGKWSTNLCRSTWSTRRICQIPWIRRNRSRACSVEFCLQQRTADGPASESGKSIACVDEWQLLHTWETISGSGLRYNSFRASFADVARLFPLTNTQITLQRAMWNRTGCSLQCVRGISLCDPLTLQFHWHTEKVFACRSH